MPTFLFLKDGELVDKVVGAKKEELQLKIDKHAAWRVMNKTLFISSQFAFILCQFGCFQYGWNLEM